MSEFLCSTEWRWSLARNITKGVLAVVVAHIDKLAGMVTMDATTRAFVVALVMAELGKHAGAPGDVAAPANKSVSVEAEAPANKSASVEAEAPANKSVSVEAETPESERL